MTGKELQKEIDREAQALNDANRDSNLKEMAVKITKMGPEVHAAYVKNKNNSGAETKMAAGGSSAGNTPGIKKIPLLRGVSRGNEEAAVGGPKDPRMKRTDPPRFVKTFAEVHYGAGEVESDSDAEEQEFNKAEAEKVQINLPSEAYAVPYADVADIIMPVLLGDDQDESGCGSDDDIMITIDAEAEELAREEDEAVDQARIKEISRELEESSREAGLLTLPPIASILPVRGTGRIGNPMAATPGGRSVPGGPTTPGGTSVPGDPYTPGGTSVPGGSSTPVSTSVPGHPLTLVGASAPRIRPTPGGASAPGGLCIHGDTPVSGDSISSKGTSAIRKTIGGASAPGGFIAPMTTPVPGCSSAPGGVARRGVPWPL